MANKFKMDVLKQHNYADGTTSTEKEATMTVSKTGDLFFFDIKGKKGEIDMFLTGEEAKKLVKYLIDVI